MCSTLKSRLHKEALMLYQNQMILTWEVKDRNINICHTGTGGMWRCVLSPHTAVCQFPGESVASGNLWKRQFAFLPHYICTVKPASSLESSRAVESPWVTLIHELWDEWADLTSSPLGTCPYMGCKRGRRDGGKEPEWCSRLSNALLLSLVLMGYLLTMCSPALRAFCACCHLWALQLGWGPLLFLQKSLVFVHGWSP